MVDVNKLVQEYQEDTSSTIPSLAKKYGVRPVDVSVMLRLSKVTVRRGRATSITDDARAKALNVRRMKALRKALKVMLLRFSYEQIVSELEAIGKEQANGTPE